MIEKYEKFLEVLGDDLKKIFEYQQEYIFCKEGCAHCCKQGDFPLSELEYKYLMLGYEKLNEETKSIIQENIKNTKKGNTDSYICPFLINNKCSVYNNRPIVCRAFGVLTEDASGNPSYPLCATMGLNFSQIYDKEKGHLSSELYKKRGFKIFPKIFRLSNKVVMNIPLAKELNLEFGEAKKMIDFL
ncbi:MAG: YkgJ family cysteine cluster protein [Cyanobacteria bacterium SIG29]|nr:YkgJ family cysteine cluster protein [Cyanobacteria bacterium SIG29]